MPTCTPTLRGDDEVDSIPPALFNGGGFVASIAFLWWALATGRLYTGSQHREIVKDKDAQIERLTKANDVKDAQIEKLSVVGEAFVKIMTAIEDMAKRRQR